MQKESAIIDLLGAQQRGWRARFPSLANRAHQTIVGYLCTRGRAGVPVRQIYGVTKELYLLDDATVRERVEDIERFGLCHATPGGAKLTGRTIVTPAETLLAAFDAYLLGVCSAIGAAMHEIAPALAGPAPMALQDRERAMILQVFDGYALAWLAGADQFLMDRNVSPARRTEARRRLVSTSYWTLMHRAMEHADHLRRGLVADETLVADQLAASVLDQTGQSFQTIRDHISWLIGQGLLDRAPGRVLRVSLAPRAGEYFDETLRQTAADLVDIAQRFATLQPGHTLAWSRPADALAGDPAAADDRENTVDHTLRVSALQAGAQGGGQPGHEAGAATLQPRVVHWLEVVSPPAAATRVVLSTVPIVIGRARPAQLLLPDGAVSRAHCQIDLVGEEVRVTDLGSTNGTFIDGQRIERTAWLHAGEVLRVGPYGLTCRRETKV